VKLAAYFTDSVHSKADNTKCLYLYWGNGRNGRQKKRPLFIIITIAAKVTDRPLRSCKWGVIKGHTGSRWWDASAQASNSGKLSITFACFALFLLLFILLVLSVLLVKLFFVFHFVSLSPFFSFFLFLVGGWGLKESISHSVYCHPTLNCDSSDVFYHFHN